MRQASGMATPTPPRSLALLFLLLLLLCATAAAAAAVTPQAAAAAAPGSRFSRRRPSIDAVEGYLKAISVSGAEFNHERAGETRAWEEAEDKTSERGWRVVRMSISLGQGGATYRKGRGVLRAWRMHEGSADTGIVRAPSSGGDKHPPVATLARTYGNIAWVCNPCRVSYERFDVKGNRSKWSVVAYATVGRHLIAGEERMRVLWAKNNDNEVTFEILSIARGNGLLGWLLFPLNRGMQTRFFEEQLRCMRQQVLGAG